jgi:hypothetical protein
MKSKGFSFEAFSEGLVKSPNLSPFYVEKQVPISIDVVLDNVFKDSTNL